MPLFKKAVIKSDGTNEMLAKILDLEDDINDQDPKCSEKISKLCSEELERQESRMAEWTERSWMAGGKEVSVIDASNKLIASRLADYKRRVEVLEHEVERRSFKFQKIALEYIRDRFKVDADESSDDEE
jgi:hypothetical protein